MISSNVLCHLSTPVYRDKSESREKYLEKRKEYFNNYLKKKTVYYENKPTILLFSNLDGDECFNKFAAGKEENHLNKNGEIGYDRKRIERFDWIFEILEKISSCDKCTQFYKLKDKDYDDRINLYCIYNNYKIVIKIKIKEKYNIIMSAYYIETQSEKNQRKKHKRKGA